MANENRKQELIDLFNILLEMRSISYAEFNAKIPFGNKANDLRELEANNNKIGLANCDGEWDGMSTLSIIATITDVLVDDRLAFKFDKDTGGLISVSWFNEIGE